MQATQESNIVNSSEHQLQTGAKGLGTLLDNLSRSEKRDFLSQDSFKDEIAAVFIGIKPSCTSFQDENPYLNQKLNDLHQQNLLKDYAISDNLFYSESHVKKVLGDNPDVFPDYSPDTNIKDYINQVFDTQIKNGENAILKAGLILGYPKDAVTSYAKYYYPHARDFENHCEKNSQNPLLDGYHIDPQDEDAISDTIKFRDSNQQEIREYLNNNEEFSNLPSEVKDYISKVRPVMSRGFRFFTTSDSESYQNFTKTNENNFKKSQIDQILKPHVQDAETLRYDQDFDYVVETISSEIDNIICNYLSWNIMGTMNLENMFEDLSTRLSEYFSKENQVDTKQEFEKFNEKLQNGVNKIKDTLIKSTKDTDGFYNPTHNKKIYPMFNDWTVKNFLFLMEKSGQDVTSIIEKHKDNPDTNIAAICPHFFTRSS